MIAIRFFLCEIWWMFTVEFVAVSGDGDGDALFHLLLIIETAWSLLPLQLLLAPPPKYDEVKERCHKASSLEILLVVAA